MVEEETINKIKEYYVKNKSKPNRQQIKTWAKESYEKNKTSYKKIFTASDSWITKTFKRNAGVYESDDKKKKNKHSLNIFYFI